MAELLADRYQLGAIIGSGGLADVHAATDLETGEAVAVKMLRAGGVGDVDRFRVEARVLQDLDHRSIVRLRQAFDGDRPFLVLDLVDGPTLADVLGSGPVPAEQVWSLGADIAEALAHAHANSIVHRDVKPANVLVGGDGRARLSDFGIARLLGSNAAGLTATNQVLGTPAYLAPEQVEGRSITPAADVYALGLVLLEAVTGRCCFTGTTAEVAIARLRRSPAVPDGMPPWAASLLTAMVAIDPTRRPPAAEIARCLREHDRPGHLREPAPAGHARPPRPSVLVGASGSGPSGDTVAIDRPMQPMWRRAAPVAAAACLAVSAMAFAISLADPGAAGRPPDAGPVRADRPVTVEPDPATPTSDHEGDPADAPVGSVAVEPASPPPDPIERPETDPSRATEDQVPRPPAPAAEEQPATSTPPPAPPAGSSDPEPSGGPDHAGAGQPGGADRSGPSGGDDRPGPPDHAGRSGPSGGDDRSGPPDQAGGEPQRGGPNR